MKLRISKYVVFSLFNIHANYSQIFQITPPPPLRNLKAVVKPKSKVTGRDASLAKAHTTSATSKSSAKHQSAIDKINEHRKIEADRMELKRQRDHDLKLEQEKTKRIKYEYKRQAAEADRASRIEELRLQIELARASVTPSPALTQPIASTSHLPQSTSSSSSLATNFELNMDDSSAFQTLTSDVHSTFPAFDDFPSFCTTIKTPQLSVKPHFSFRSTHFYASGPIFPSCRAFLKPLQKRSPYLLNSRD